MDLDGVKLLADLRQPDEMTLRFGPYGLGGPLPPENVARLQAASIARAVLVEDVPQEVRGRSSRC